jgi:hypothetical protein
MHPGIFISGNGSLTLTNTFTLLTIFEVEKVLDQITCTA